MLPSATVENYLKAIYLGGATGGPGRQLLPMGQLASALGVAPGTATTMVKTLADSGLVLYEPYTGVALTAAGERLAALVLRRHRLIELFLVRVMGYSWDEVHEEAEQLEHVVTDRLIDRIDEMLGRPEADPHGDPIPNSEGLVKSEEAHTLLTCPLHTRVTVTRIVDQDKEFLRFVEGQQLKPGESIEVEARDAPSDSVRVRSKDDQRITIGTRAASKLLVRIASALLLLAALTAPVSAQDRAAMAEPFRNGRSSAIGNLFAVHGGASLIWRARPMVNVMMESVLESSEQVQGGRAVRRTAVTLAPGVRGGWNVGEAQLILALGAPDTGEGGQTNAALVAYLSYELPFTQRR